MKSYSEYREFSGVLGSDELKAEAFLLNYLSFKLSVLGLGIAEKELLQSPLFIKEVASLITFLHDLHGDIYLDVEGAALDGYRTPDEPGYIVQEPVHTGARKGAHKGSCMLNYTQEALNDGEFSIYLPLQRSGNKR